MKTMLLRAGLLLALIFAITAPADANQGSVCMPTSGVVSGLNFSIDVNAGLKALITSHSGASAPANDCTGAPILGQAWLDTGVTPYQWRLYDGAVWLAMGAADTSTDTWSPPIGGGAATKASATTTDLWSVPQSYLTISGTTAITKLAGTSDSVAGTMKVVSFSGVLALTYNATQLITPTGATITTAAGDKAFVVSLGGGNAVVVDYIRANGTPLANIVFAGDTGSGGVAGTVPAPPAGSAALGQVLGAGGAFTAPVPAGTIVDYAGLTAPGGWLMAYGQTVSRSTYANLWAALHSSATFTVTIASPAVFTSAGHGLLPGAQISLATTGLMPTGLASATTYYVIAAGLTSSTFEVSTTLGGAAVNTSITQNGVHTFTFAPYGLGDYSTTFGLPDARGRILAAADNMGGTAAGRLTNPVTGGIDGTVLGNNGGEQQHQLIIAEMPSHNHSTSPGSSHGLNGGGSKKWSDGDSAGAGGGITSSSTGGDGPHNNVQPTLIVNKIIRY